MTEPEGGQERWLEHRVEPEEGGRQVRDVLLRSLRLSKQLIRRLAQSDGVRLNGFRPYLSSPVRPGDVLAIRLSPAEESSLRPVPMQLEIVLEDQDLLVVDKPPGILVHPTRRSHVHTLAQGVLAHYRSLGVSAGVHPVHRLDRNTSGLVVFAKHPLAHQRMDRQLRARSLKRSYLAVVQGGVSAESGRIEAPIRRDPDEPHLRISRGDAGAEARTSYRVVERLPAATLVEVELETGRTHQIRVHMAHIGHPLVSDTDYGGEIHPLCPRQALHAWRLSFVHPMSRETVTCSAPLPGDLEDLLRALRGIPEA